MTPAKATLLKCPFCDKEKEVLTLASGNTFRGRQWSDLKSVYPMFPKVSPIQKCPSCGKYYFTDNVEKKLGNDYSYEEGNLTYQELKEAAVQFRGSLVKKDKDTLNMLLLWAYNELYNREGVDITEVPIEEREYIEDVLDELLERDDVDNVVYAEFLREAVAFDNALDLLEICHPEDESLAGIVKRMKQYARDRKTMAFEIKEAIMDTPKKKTPSKVEFMKKFEEELCIKNGLEPIKRKKKADNDYTIEFKRH